MAGKYVQVSRKKAVMFSDNFYQGELYAMTAGVVVAPGIEWLWAISSHDSMILHCVFFPDLLCFLILLFLIGELSRAIASLLGYV